MKLLSQILPSIKPVSIQGNADVQVTGVSFDSRTVEQGHVFVAVKGTQVDGHEFIEKALSSGASVIVCEDLPMLMTPEATWIQVANSGEFLGHLSSGFYKHPSRSLKLIGITGTNGKTSCVTLLHQLFMELGYSTGLLSTVENKINNEVIPSTHTTPDPVSLNQLLSQMVEEGCTHCFMEVSSHSVVQNRVAGLEFGIGVFTNITHDHLDYHGTFDNYIRAKKQFFDHLSADAFALINIDDRRGNVMVQNTQAVIKTFGLKKLADYKARMISNTLQGLQLEIGHHQSWFKLIGEFNAYNILTAFAVASLLGEQEENILTQLSALKPPAGRFEQIVSNKKILGIVDYAHTPDALKNVLNTINDLRGTNEKVITVVGCGGNRDANKRPKMADIAARKSDSVIFTSDNPRDENPVDILKQMEDGVENTDKHKTKTVVDRKEAIKEACLLAEPNDVILLAGKGHEAYQEIKGVKEHFDDREILRETFKELDL